MPKRHDDLFAGIANFQALHAAFKAAIKGKLRAPGAAAFAAHLESNLLRLETELLARTWRPGRYTEIKIHDPKPRIVSAAPFRDRVVHHALHAVIGPIFERGFIAHSYANRIGKGTHRAIVRYEKWRDYHAHVLRCDIYRYFPAIDHAILKQTIRRRIGCPNTLWLIDSLIDGSNDQEPVTIHYPGDTLLAPLERRRGLPIGNLTSQFFANVYLDGLDHFVTEILGAPYLRYVDDFALFHNHPSVLAAWRDRIGAWLTSRRLSLHPGKTLVQSTRAPSAFLGLVLRPSGRRLPEQSVTRFRGRLRGSRDRWRAGALVTKDVDTRIQAWIAHASFADTWRLRHALFRGGWFDPARRPDRPLLRAFDPTPFGAAAPGTTIPGTSAPAAGTGTIPGIGTRTSASEWPARLHAKRGHARAGRVTARPGAPRLRPGAVMMSGAV
jgi:RNA-directed DNA polymerase